MSTIGQKAPVFYAQSTAGDINFPEDFKDIWTVLYFYVGDFLPSSAYDILELDKKQPKFKSYGSEIIAMSTDSLASHIAFDLSLRNLKKDGKPVDIKLISDKDLSISENLGISNTDKDDNLNEKAVIIIDPEGNIRSFHKYSHNMGINVTEIERELLSLQTAYAQNGLSPAGWTPGDDILEYPPKTTKAAQSSVSDNESKGLYCLDWYICFKADTGLRKQTE